MSIRATDRFLTAVIVTVPAALVAVLAGRPDAAALVAPWIVLLVLGLSRRSLESPTVSVVASAERVVVGDDIELTTSIEGGSGTISVSHQPSAEFWRRGEEDGPPANTRTEGVIADGAAELTCVLPASEWGQHDLGLVRYEVTHPYGLFRETGESAAVANVLVHPTPTQLHNLLAPWMVRRISGTHGSKELGRGIEYADVRPFTSGDSLREINWRASARSDELWVSQRHPDRATDVILLVDSFVESGHDVRTTVGLAIEAAVGLAESHLAVSDRIGLVELGGLVRWVSPGTGRLQLQRLTDGLLSTGLYANAAQRDLRVIPARVLPPRSFVVALSPLFDERFINALFMLSGRGHDVAVIECATVASENSSQDEGVAATRLLAGRVWEAERQIVRDRLAGRGVAVAAWGPGTHLDLVLSELTRRRQPMTRAGRR
ncbi:MAG: DUF58 domain-containing protein [Acidimicrobiales bacterium]|nr:MAG: DUF58 domain-containing protein [Acidimicrobiales bacterium]